MSPTEFINNAGAWISFLIQVGTLCTLVYTLKVFLRKPETTQDERIAKLEAWQVTVDARLERGNGHFDEIDKGNRVTQEALLALMAHAIDGNDIDELKQAKKKLQSYLVEK